MHSRSYWREREFDRMHSLQKAEDKVVRDINRAYNSAFNEISRELNDFYVKYATDNHITLQQAQRQLTLIEAREYRERMNELRALYESTEDENVLRQMAQLSARKEVTRKQALLDSIDAKLIEVTEEVQLTIEDHLTGAYTRGYQGALDDLEIPKTTINHKAIEDAIRYPFQGAMFSDRIWRSKDQLLNWINDDLTKGMVRGDSIQKMGKNLRERANVTKYQAERLVRTESCNAYTQGTLNGYKESNVVNGYETLTAGDERMCGTCSDRDAIIVPLDRAMAGDNLPPYHP